MNQKHAIDLTAAIENAAEITDISASSVTQCSKLCEVNCVIVQCDTDDQNVTASAPVTQCIKQCEVILLCDGDGTNVASDPLTQSSKLCEVVSCDSA